MENVIAIKGFMMIIRIFNVNNAIFHVLNASMGLNQVIAQPVFKDFI